MGEVEPADELALRSAIDFAAALSPEDHGAAVIVSESKVLQSTYGAE